jgi:hypothetical protein
MWGDVFPTCGDFGWGDVLRKQKIPPVFFGGVLWNS